MPVTNGTLLHKKKGAAIILLFLHDYSPYSMKKRNSPAEEDDFTMLTRSIAQQVAREPRVQEHGPGPHKGLHKARPRRDARQKAVQKAVFAPGPFEKRPRQIHKEPQKKLSVARHNGQKMTPKADAAPMWTARRSGGILAAQRKTEKYRLRKKQASLLSGDGMRREPMPVKEACVSPCSGCNMSTAFHPRHAKDSEWTSHSATSSNWP